MEKSDLIKVLYYVRGIYGKMFEYPTGNKMQDEGIGLAWLSVLKNYTIEEVQNTTYQLMLEQPKFYPKAPEIAKRIIENGMPEKLSAEEAYAEVYHSAHHNAIGSSRFSDETNRALQTLGGFDRLYNGSEKDWTYNRKLFIEAYNGIVSREFTSNVLKLAGIKKPDAKQLEENNG